MEKKNNRFSHAGKSKDAKRAYQDFINSKFFLDKTEKEKPDSSKTDVSSVDDDKLSKSENKPRGKSLWLKMKDIDRSTIFGGLILAFMVSSFGVYVHIATTQSVQSEKISNIEKDIDSRINDSIKKTDETRNLFEVFKAEVSKDIEYLKKILKL